MLPDSLKGFAPTVRGIAKSNAVVTIKQNGYVIYQTYVSPGAFAINDLYPTSSSGDLQVTVKESDGSENTFTVPYSAVPLLQREGRLKYALTAGKYRSTNDDQDEVNFARGERRSMVCRMVSPFTAVRRSATTTTPSRWAPG